MLTRLKKIITGLSIPREYVCLALENFSDPLSVYMTEWESKEFMEVTTRHFFLGYKPLVIGIVFSADAPQAQASEICLHFNQQVFQVDRRRRHFFSDQSSVARLALKKIQTKRIENYKIVFYEGVYGQHHFLSLIRRGINSFRLKWRKRQEGNVDLPGNLYDQVRIAYSVPRIISIISVSDGSLINMFPTDLHGSLTNRYYIGSLRIGGKANEQVERLKRLAISEVDASWYKKAYGLGKNHMRDLKSPNHFDVSSYSRTFQIPLPEGVIRYKELKWIDCLDVGIHRLHLCEVVDAVEVRPGKTLAHIHHYMAQWREDHSLKTEYLLQ